MRWWRDNGVSVLPDWPANSPDLSPVEHVWAIMKRYILERFGLKTPLSLPQLDGAVFEAYDRISWRTVAILTMSAKYRVRACIERNGRFVGDLIGECCRRARVELETQSDLLLLSVPSTLDEQELPVFANDGDDRPLEPPSASAATALPTFRQWSLNHVPAND